MTIKAGDYVTWRSKGKPHSLGFTGCKVLALGKTEDGRDAVRLDLGRFGEANALCDDLMIEENCCKEPS